MNYSNLKRFGKPFYFKMISMEYRRHLPHITPIFGDFFITYRLKNSLPKELIQKIREEREFEKSRILKSPLDPASFQKALMINDKRYFGAFDRFLDTDRRGDHFLLLNEIQEIVRQSIFYYDGKDYELVCFCIMSNHVHLVIKNVQRELFKILHSIKLYSSRQSNIFLNRTGSAFWEEESYDHLIHDRNELERIIAYTLNNPVKINLVENWKDWVGTYCNENYIV